MKKKAKPAKYKSKEEENILLRTHNMQTMERTGDKIFYPKEYNDYNNDDYNNSLLKLRSLLC